MRFLRLIPALSSVLLMASCATLIDGQAQDVTILTPGATEAECTLDNGIRYAVVSGETVQVMRNESDIVVECYASGNRYRKMSIESDGNKWAIGNVATGVIPGVTFDYFAKGLYEYPETITVDFVGVPTLGFEMPDYHNKDAPNPYDQPIEYMGPSVPRLDSDKAFLKNEVRKRDRETGNPFATQPQPGVSGGDGITPMPGSVSGASGGPAVPPAPSAVPRGSTAEELNRSMNPNVFQNN